MIDRRVKQFVFNSYGTLKIWNRIRTFLRWHWKCSGLCRCLWFNIDDGARIIKWSAQGQTFGLNGLCRSFFQQFSGAPGTQSSKSQNCSWNTNSNNGFDCLNAKVSKMVDCNVCNLRNGLLYLGRTVVSYFFDFLYNCLRGWQNRTGCYSWQNRFQTFSIAKSNNGTTRRVNDPFTVVIWNYANFVFDDSCLGKACDGKVGLIR